MSEMAPDHMKIINRVTAQAFQASEKSPESPSFYSHVQHERFCLFPSLTDLRPLPRKKLQQQKTHPGANRQLRTRDTSEGR